METYLFYTTHLVMTVCITLVIAAAMPENRPAYIRRLSDLMTNLCSFAHLKERLVWRSMILNLLTIGLQLATQLLR